MFCSKDYRCSFSISVKIFTQLPKNLTPFRISVQVMFSCILLESDKFITFVFTLFWLWPRRVRRTEKLFSGIERIQNIFCKKPNSCHIDTWTLSLSAVTFWLWQEAQEVTLSVCVSVCLSVCDIVEFFTLSKRKILRLVSSESWASDHDYVEKHSKYGAVRVWLNALFSV